MGESLANIDFYGNKVLMLKQEKDTAWYKAYKDIAKAFKEFIVKNAHDIMEWTGSQNA